MKLFSSDTPTTPPPDIPTVAEFSDSYRSTTAHIKKFESEVAAENQEYFKLKTSADDDTFIASRVSDLVSGRSANNSPNPVLERKLRIDAIKQSVPDKLEAIHILRQKQTREHTEASRKITDQLRPENDRLHKAIANGLLTIHAAMLEMDSIGKELRAKEISPCGLFVLPLSLLGHPMNPDSELAEYFRQSVKDGHVKKVPAAFIPKPYSTEGLPANGRPKERALNNGF